MKARKTQRTNLIIRYPGGTQDQDLPALVEAGEPIRTVWRLDEAERAAIATGKANVEVALWASQHPPISVGITRDRLLPINPDERVVDPGVSLWVELERDLVVDLIAELGPAAEDLERLRAADTCPQHASRMAPLERLAELHARLLHYLPHMVELDAQDDDEESAG